MEFVLKTRADSSTFSVYRSLAPSQWSSPQPVCLRCPRFRPAPSLPTEPNYSPRFPVCPRCQRFRLAPSQQSSPQAYIAQGFLSVHDVAASISIPLRQSKLNENPGIGDAFGKKR